MPTKIKKISITGLRGVQKTMELPLSEKSILLYGDNGTGKSSISDSVEWFFNDSVSHLSGSEIELKDAMRNANLNYTEVSSVELDFSKATFSSDKTLANKKGKLVKNDCTVNLVELPKIFFFSVFFFNNQIHFCPDHHSPFCIHHKLFNSIFPTTNVK